MTHIADSTLVRNLDPNPGTPVLAISHSKTLEVLCKEIYRSTILPLRENQMDIKFSGEAEALLLTPLSGLAVKFFANPFEKDMSISSEFKSLALGYEALARILSIVTTKDTTSALVSKMFSELNWTVKSWNAAQVEKDGQTSGNMTKFFNDLLTLKISSIDPKDYTSKDIKELTNADTVGDLFNGLVSYSGLPNYPNLLPDQRIGIRRMCDLIEQALEAMLFPEILFSQETRTVTPRYHDFLSLASAYAYWRHIATDENTYTANVAGRLDSVMFTGKIESYRRSASVYAWTFMNFHLAGPRVMASATYSMYKEIWKLLSLLPTEDKNSMDAMEAMLKVYDTQAFPGGTNLFDQLVPKMFSAIKDVLGDASAILVPAAIVDNLNLKPIALDPNYVVPTGFDAYGYWVPRITHGYVWEYESSLISTMRSGFMAVRQFLGELHTQYRTIASPGAIEDLAYFNLPSDLITVNPSYRWTATPEAIPVRDITKLPQGTVTLPKLINNEPFWSKHTYQFLFWNRFIQNFAQKEYSVLRMYWPAMSDIEMVDPWYSKFFRSYIPAIYVEDIMSSRSSKVSNSSFKSMMFHLAKESNVPSDYFGYMARALSQDSAPEKIVSGISSMMAVYTLPLKALDKGVGASLPEAAQPIIPEIPTVYGVPFMLMEEMQPRALNEENHFIISLPGAEIAYIFKLHERFPTPGRCVTIPYYLGGSSWIDIPIRQDVFSAAVRLKTVDVRKQSYDLLSEYVPNQITKPNASNFVKTVRGSSEYASSTHEYSRLVLEEQARMMKALARSGKSTLNGEIKLLKGKTSYSAGASLVGTGIEIDFPASTLSQVSAYLPHTTFKVGSPADYGFSWEDISNWNSSKVFVSNQGMGQFKITKAVDDQVISFGKDDVIKAINESEASIIAFMHLNNIKKISVSTKTEPLDSESKPAISLEGDNTPPPKEDEMEPAPTKPEEKEPKASEDKAPPAGDVTELPKEEEDKDKKDNSDGTES